jgi:hypothetical protein
MPEKKTIERARRAKRQGKSPSTQAGEFIREEIHHVREGKHGARSPEQAIAIGLSKARRAGVRLPPPKRGRVSAETREAAARDARKGRQGDSAPKSPRRSAAMRERLKHEGRAAAAPKALSAHAHRAAMRRSPQERHASAMKAVQSRTHAERSASARKAARTRARNT